MPRLQIRELSLTVLKPDLANARQHDTKQIDKIAASIRRFGFNSPIAIDADGSILCGHGRYAAAVQLGLDTVPTVCLSHLSAAERRAYMLADNRIAEDAKWEPELLAAEIQRLVLLDPEFEITDTGFEIAEIDTILMAANDEGDSDEDDAEVEPSVVPSICRPGDLWQIGEHLVFCGDALDATSYAVLLNGEKADMVFSDPPYNRPIRAISNNGRTLHREFVQASGEMSSGAFESFLAAVFERMVSFSADGSIHFICMDWRGLRELLAAGEAHYSELKNLVVWVKRSGGMGSLYRSQHELIAVYKSGTAKHTNNVQLGATGRNRTNVWQYAGNNSFHRGRDAEVALHPTIKPVALCADAMLDCSRRRAIVLDSFGGSGTTAISAERAGRRARLIELDPHYVDVTLYRARKLLGLSAVNLWTGEVLEPITKSRATPRRHRSAAK